jgi:hypothetical protein
MDRVVRFRLRQNRLQRIAQSMALLQSFGATIARFLRLVPRETAHPVAANHHEHDEKQADEHQRQQRHEHGSAARRIEPFDYGIRLLGEQHAGFYGGK